MPSSKGKPTDPKLREQVKKDVKQMEKGGGKGQWSAWKAGELARQYEAKGGGYTDTGDNPNEAKKGEPTPKKSAVEKGDRKAKGAPVGESKKAASSKKSTTGSSVSKKSAEDKKTKSSAQTTGAKKTGGARAQPKRASGRKATAASA